MKCALCTKQEATETVKVTEEHCERLGWAREPDTELSLCGTCAKAIARIVEQQ